MNTDKTMTVPMPKLTPADMAELFWAMDDEEQGKFFDELGTLVLSTPSPFLRDIGSMFGLDWQMYHASQKATALGQDVMRRISENGKMWLAPNHEAERDRVYAGLSKSYTP